MKPLTYRILCVLPLLFGIACSGVKDLPKADLDLPETFAKNQSADSLTLADIEWWRFYTDSALSDIIGHTLENNRNLLKAAAKVEEMRRLYGVQKLNYAPELSALAGGNYETNNYDGKGVTKDPEYSIKATVSWEVNLWGAMTWSQRGAKARYLATEEDYRAMRMVLVAEVASAYFRLIALDNELSIVRQTLITRREALEQARLRFEGGLTSETVYQQAKVEYATTASLVPDLERRLSEAQNAVTLLMGEYPQEYLSRGVLYLNVVMPETLPAGIPSELLLRRPDIRSAEQRLKAAAADVGLSYADRFPRFRFSFTGGVENDRLPDLLKSSFTRTVGDITGTVFDFGKKKRRYEASKEAYRQALYDYEQAVLTAVTEVNNGITAFNRVREAAQLKTELRDAAYKYVKLARLQYRGGNLNYLDVLDAQRRYFEAQIGVSNSLRDEYLAIVFLYKALGGGWEEKGGNQRVN